MEGNSATEQPRLRKKKRTSLAQITDRNNTVNSSRGGKKTPVHATRLNNAHCDGNGQKSSTEDSQLNASAEKRRNVTANQPSAPKKKTVFHYLSCQDAK
jgi:hypothetical protein